MTTKQATQEELQQERDYEESVINDWERKLPAMQSALDATLRAFGEGDGAVTSIRSRVLVGRGRVATARRRIAEIDAQLNTLDEVERGIARGATTLYFLKSGEWELEYEGTAVAFSTTREITREHANLRHALGDLVEYIKEHSA